MSARGRDSGGRESERERERARDRNATYGHVPGSEPRGCGTNWSIQREVSPSVVDPRLYGSPSRCCYDTAREFNSIPLGYSILVLVGFLRGPTRTS